MKKNISKPTLVFLHGWGGCWQSWFPIIKALEKDYTIFTPDLPGHGQEKIERPLNLSDYSNFVKKYLEKNNIKNPILIGHSFGGAIVCNLLIKNPSLAQKIILVDAAPIRPVPTFNQKMIFFTTQSIKKIFSIPFLKPFFQKTRQFAYRIIGLTKSDYYSIQNPILKQTFSTIIREDLTDKLSQIKAKTLIIWGEKDLSTPLQQGEDINKLITNSKLIVIPKASHFSYLDNQPKFITEVKNFIES